MLELVLRESVPFGGRGKGSGSVRRGLEEGGEGGEGDGSETGGQTRGGDAARQSPGSRQRASVPREQSRARRLPYWFSNII